jgi:hypothetical protein
MKHVYDDALQRTLIVFDTDAAAQKYLDAMWNSLEGDPQQGPRYREMSGVVVVRSSQEQAFLAGRDARWEAFRGDEDDAELWLDPDATQFVWREQEKEVWAEMTGRPPESAPFTPTGDFEPLPALLRLRRAWRRATAQERATFLEEIDS